MPSLEDEMNASYFSESCVNGKKRRWWSDLSGTSRRFIALMLHVTASGSGFQNAPRVLAYVVNHDVKKLLVVNHGRIEHNSKTANRKFLFILQIQS